MPRDFITDFTSEQNLQNLANQPGVNSISPETSTQFPVGLDDYIPPAIPNNVVKLPQLLSRRYITREIEPPEALQTDKFNALANLLTSTIKEKESSGNYQAINKDRPGNTASGAYQYTDSTWNNYMGYPKAALAPAWVQDKRFQDDVTSRLEKFGGDPYKAIAAHYLPALASTPEKWDRPFKVHGRTVKPVLSYVRYVVNGTPLEKGLDAYLAQYK